MKLLQEQQRGLTLSSWLAVLVVTVIILIFVMRIAPIYWEHYTAVNTIESLNGDPSLGQQNLTEAMPIAIDDLLQKRFSINNITRIKPENIKMTPIRGGVNVNLKYEVRIPFVFNIDMLIYFDDTIPVVQQ